jgi:DNA-binding beta-propeller fold protein YncE
VEPVETPALRAVGLLPVRAGGLALNPHTHRLYLVSCREEMWGRGLEVLDSRSHILLGQVPLPHGVHFLAVNPATNRIYAFGGGDEVSVLDGASNQLLPPLPQPRAAWMCADPGSNRLYLLTWIHEELVVLDGTTHAVLARVESVEPGKVALNPQTGKLYVVQPRAPGVLVVDTETYHRQTIPFPPPFRAGESMPNALAVNPQTNRIYVLHPSLGSHLGVIDGDTNRLLRTIPVGRSPAKVDVNPVTQRLFVTGEFWLLVLDERNDQILARLEFDLPTDRFLVHPQASRVYVPTEGGQVILFDELPPR